MDRQIVYPGQILPETTLLQMAKDAMIGSAKLAAAMLGTSTIANGFAVTPTGPASLQIVVAPGEIYALANIDSLAFSTLPADTTHSILKQGILLDGVTLSCPAPTTTGQSINYLVQVTYQDQDSTPVLLPYYNSANPALPYSGMGNNGLTQNTSRKGVAIAQVKAGASAATGSQVTPAPDSGYVGLYVVTVAFGQTTITSVNIVQYSGAPLLPAGLLQSIQTGKITTAQDVGSANAYAARFTPAITSLTDGMTLNIKAANANTTASTFTPAPGVISTAPIVGAAHSALQGGEIAVNGEVWLQWNSSIGAGSWVLLNNTGGGQQVSAATNSLHALQLGQAVGRLANIRVFTSSGTYTPTTGTTSVLVEVLGAGGAGGGSASTASGAAAIGGGGSSGAYAKSYLTSGFSGTAFTVGSAGAVGAAGANGGNGGSSSFGAISAGGGNGGAAGASNPVANGGIAQPNGSPTTATGGNILNARGNASSVGIIISNSSGTGFSGQGNASMLGGGGNGVIFNTGAGGAAGSFGAGGGGGMSLNVAAAQAGGAGGAGIIIITEYF